MYTLGGFFAVLDSIWIGASFFVLSVRNTCAQEMIVWHSLSSSGRFLVAVMCMTSFWSVLINFFVVFFATRAIGLPGLRFHKSARSFFHVFVVKFQIAFHAFLVLSTVRVWWIFIMVQNLYDSKVLKKVYWEFFCEQIFRRKLLEEFFRKENLTDRDKKYTMKTVYFSPRRNESYLSETYR